MPDRARQPVTEVDLLRAAVVFLHATLEDALRSALEWKWPETCIELDGLGVVLGARVDAKVSLRVHEHSRRGRGGGTRGRQPAL